MLPSTDDDEVVWVVVEQITVAVTNEFVRSQRSPELLLHDETVEWLLLSTHPDEAHALLDPALGRCDPSAVVAQYEPAWFISRPESSALLTPTLALRDRQTSHTSYQSLTGKYTYPDGEQVTDEDI